MSAPPPRMTVLGGQTALADLKLSDAVSVLVADTMTRPGTACAVPATATEAATPASANALVRASRDGRNLMDTSHGYWLEPMSGDSSPSAQPDAPNASSTRLTAARHPSPVSKPQHSA